MTNIHSPQHLNPAFLRQVWLICSLVWIIVGVQAQDCTNHINVPGGTQYFSCTEVTVTPDDSVLFLTDCNIGPYVLGVGASGSVTFAFSEPVSGVTLAFHGMDYRDFPLLPIAYERMSVEVNGAPYPFQDAGVPACLSPCVLDGTGGVQCPPNVGGAASCKDFNILTPINSLTIINTHVNIGFPEGVYCSIYFCCTPCEVRAGLIPSSPLSLCPGELAIVPPAAPNILPPGTMLEYILFSDPSDTLGSILFFSDTPSFAFDPAVMQEGVPYYITAIAGNELNGHVDLSHRCLDISDKAIPVTWWPKPTVVFTTDDSDVCKGECFDVRLEFSGEPPFTLTYNSTYSGQMTKTFFGHTGTIQLCVPGNVMPGDLNIQAIKVTDKYCVCE